MAINETATGNGSVAITGTATGVGSRGVIGKSDHGGVKGEGDKGAGVWGTSKHGHGVQGQSESAEGSFGVFGEAIGSGVVGVSQTWMGVYGESKSTTGGVGVMGEHKGAGLGVKAVSKDGVGLAAYSTTNEAIHAETHSEGGTIAAYNFNKEGTGFAVFAKKEGNGFAGFFDGNVWVSKKLTVGDDIVLANADCAEDFDVAGEVKVEPGTVMVLGNEGALFESHQAYDKRVAGVISGAGDYKPGIVLDKRQSTTGNRQPVALMGKVFCKVDAQFGAIEVGDLLTTSYTPGHAMKVDDPVKSLGAMIGKALSPLKEGQGMIPILVALQ